MEHDLSDEECDRLVAATMNKLATKAGEGVQVQDLSPNIMTHHVLRRSIVLVAYELGLQVGQRCRG